MGSSSYGPARTSEAEKFWSHNSREKVRLALMPARRSMLSASESSFRNAHRKVAYKGRSEHDESALGREFRRTTYTRYITKLPTVR